MPGARAAYPSAAEWQVNLLTKLLRPRTISLASMYCVPPRIYARFFLKKPCRDWRGSWNAGLASTRVRVKRYALLCHRAFRPCALLQTLRVQLKGVGEVI